MSRLSLVISVLLAALCLSMLPPALTGAIDDVDEVRSLFARGQRQLREGNWHDAAQTFRQLEGRFPDSPNLDLFVFHRAKADYYFGEWSKAIAGFTYFTSQFPRSPEVPYALFFLGNTFYRNGDFTKASGSYVQAYRLSEDPRLDDLVLVSLETMFESAGILELGRADLQRVPRDKVCPLAKTLAAALTARGDENRAREVMDLCPESSDSTASGTERKRPPKDGLEVALVLPFSGELQSYSEDIYNGALVAAEKYREETGRSLKLSQYDTHGDPIDAARIIARLDKESDVAAVIGPLTSEAAAVSSAILSSGELPLMVPAATEAGLTQLCTSCFQLSPNIELQGVRMAQYARDSLRADSAAIFTSTNTQYLRIARAFSEHFEKLGGTTVAIEYYRARDKDFGPYIRDLKALLWGTAPDSIFFTNEEGDTLDPDGIPVSVDCLYIPGNADQLRLLLEQIRFYKLDGAYLGSDGWADDAVYRLGDNVTRRAVFPSPFLQGTYSDEYLQFAAAYDARLGKQPQRLAALGYDAMQLILQAAGNGRSGRKDITQGLKDVKSYNGAAGKVAFGEYRENVHMPLYRIEDGRAEFMGQIRQEPDSAAGE